jgi:hypothetical protein
LSPAERRITSQILPGDDEDRDAYRKEKSRCAELVIHTLERERPRIGEQVEVVDVSTPITRSDIPVSGIDTKTVLHLSRGGLM